MRLPIPQLSCRLLFGKASLHPCPSATLQSTFGSLRLLVFPKANIAFEREEICECDGDTVHKLSQRRLTADWLAPRENDCWRMDSKVSSDWLPSYIKVKRPVLEIFKMDGYLPDSTRTSPPPETQFISLHFIHVLVYHYIPCCKFFSLFSCHFTFVRPIILINSPEPSAVHVIIRVRYNFGTLRESVALMNMNAAI